jgi:signal transduction histidine kinase/CheY-like chemotaxis protein
MSITIMSGMSARRARSHGVSFDVTLLREWLAGMLSGDCRCADTPGSGRIRDAATPFPQGPELTITPNSIRGRVQLAAVAFALAMLIPSAGGLRSVSTLAERGDRAVSEAIATQRLSAQFVAAAMEAVHLGQSYILAPSAQLEVAFRQKGRQAHDIARLLSSDATASAEVASAIARLDGRYSELESRLVRAQRYIDLGANDEARRDLENSAPLQAEMLREVGLLGEAESAYLASATDAMRRATSYQGTVFLVVFGIVSVVGALITRWLARSVGRPLARLVAHAAEIAARRSDARTAAESVPREFAALAIAMNDAGEALARAAEAESVAHRHQRLALVGRLASGVAHELNNPLHTIQLTIELLQQDASDPVLRRELDVVREQAARARAIVRDLTNSSREGAGSREVVPADSIVRRAADELSRLAGIHGASLSLGLPSHSLPDIEVHREDLTRLLGILVANAAYSSGASGTVTVSAGDADDTCWYAVEDHGAGLSEGAMARLFEPFFTTKPVGQGTGLGLTVALGIAESHGGSISARNRADGPGARFEVRLPKAHGAACAIVGASGRPRVPAPACSEVIIRPSVTQPRALIVDDEPTVRAVIARILGRAGWHADEAGNGAAAIELIVAAESSQDPYAFILCDLRMPSMSGIALHDMLSEQYPESLRRMTIASGDLTSPDVAELLARTKCRVLEKPLNLKDVLDAAASTMHGHTEEECPVAA